MPTTFTDFDPAQPDGSVDNGSAALADIKNNDGALRVYVLLALFSGYTYSQSGGTAAQPTTIKMVKGATTIRLTLTWGTTGGEANQVKTIVPEISTDTEATWAAVGGTITNTYDAGGELTATAGGGGFVSKLWSLWGLVRKVIADLAAHIAAAGTAVHGLGNMSTQSKAAVDIDGGAIDGTPIGATSAEKVTAKNFRDKAEIAGGLSGAKSLDIDTYGYFELSHTGSITLSISGTPAANTGAGALLAFTTSGNGAHTVTLPSGVSWVGGTAPTINAGVVKTHIMQFYKSASGAIIGSYLGTL